MSEASLSPLTDPRNEGGGLVPEDEQDYDVVAAYSLLADVPLPPVLRGDDLER